MVAACPAEASTAFLFDFWPARPGAKTAFFFCPAKEKAVLDSEKEKVDRWKSWGDAVQQDRLPMLRCCSSGERLWVSFCFRRLAFERPVVPLAPLPLSGWNTAPCSLVSTPPWWAVFGKKWAVRVRTPAPTGVGWFFDERNRPSSCVGRGGSISTTFLQCSTNGRTGAGQGGPWGRKDVSSRF